MTLFELAAKLTLDKSGFDKGVSEAEGRGRNLGTKISGFMGASVKAVSAGLVAATGAIAGLTKSAVDAYANYEQLKGGVETLFKTSADTMMAYADQAYKTAGLSANDYMQTTTSFAASLIQSTSGNVAQAADLANQAVIDMADNANKMGTDMEAIQNAYMGFSKQNYTMLDNLKLGYGGTKTEMERLILDAEQLDASFKATRDENGDLVMSFGDVVQAIHVVQTNMGITGTTALEASSTISGSVGTMKAAWDNLLVGLGDDTQNMDALINNFVESVVTVVGNLVPRIQTILEGIGSLVTQMVDVIAAQLPGLIETLIPPLLEAATNLFTTLAGALPGLLEIIVQQLPMVVESLVAVIPMLVEGLLALLPELVTVGTQMITTLIEGIATALPEIIPAAVEAVTTMVAALIENIPLLLDAGIQLLGGLIEGVINAIPTLVAALPQIITALTKFFSDSVSTIATSGAELLGSLVKNVSQAISSIVAVLPQIITALVKFFAESIPQLVDAGVKLLVALIENLPDIINTIVTAIPQIITAICDALTENLPTIIQAGVDLFVALIKNLPEIIVTIAGAIPQIIEGLANALANNLSSVWKIGEDLIKGIWTGIGNVEDWLWEKLKGWCGGVLNHIKSLFGIHSPSALFRDEVGKMLGMGMAEGIEDSVGDVKNAGDELLGAIPNIKDQDFDFSANVKRNITDAYSSSYQDMASAFIEAIKTHGLYAIVDGGQASEALEPLISAIQGRQISQMERSGLYATV